VARTAGDFTGSAYKFLPQLSVSIEDPRLSDIDKQACGHKRVFEVLEDCQRLGESVPSQCVVAAMQIEIGPRCPTCGEPALIAGGGKVVARAREAGPSSLKVARVPQHSPVLQRSLGTLRGPVGLSERLDALLGQRPSLVALAQGIQ
jgi:hypothetical protein